MKLFWFTILLLVNFFSLHGQSLEVMSVNDGAYPEIMVRVKVSGSENDSISILEKGNTVVCDIQNSDPSQNYDERMFVFLVEDSYYFHHKEVFPHLKKTLMEIANNIGKKDNLNILYFGTPGRIVKALSAGQSQHPDLMQNNIEDYFLPQTDSTFIDNRLFESISKSLDYIKSQRNNNNAIIFTIISRGLNLSNVREMPEEVINDIKKTGLYVNVMIYDSESYNCKRELENLAQLSDGDSYIFTEHNLESKLLQVMEKMSKVKPRNLYQEKIIRFNAAQKGTSNSFVIKYGNKEELCEYTNPNQTSFLGKYPIVIVIIISVLLILTAVILYLKTRTKVLRHIDASAQEKMKNIMAQNKSLKHELEKYKRHPISILKSFDNFNIDENLIGSGKMIPKLLVQDQDQKMVFDLSKMIMTIGRKESNDIVLQNRTVSGSHATLSFEGGVFYITDNNSTNGTFINDIKITKGKICPNDIVRIGSVFAKINY